jgi:hypothetical protein
MDDLEQELGLKKRKARRAVVTVKTAISQRIAKGYDEKRDKRKRVNEHN